jgi:phosphoribosylformylglycinamidine cyclo-ligase
MSPSPKKPKGMTYKQAGVDLDAGISITKDIGRLARSTFNKSTLSEIGSFGGLFRPDWKKFRDPVLVGSTDGVGTKVILAANTGRISGVGEDIVNHCVNDILVQGAVPLFFLDYIAFPEFSKTVVVEVLKGVSKACRENGCVLLGGETAEMPDVYHKGHFDIAGTIIGAVDRHKIIDGSQIRPGDVIIGLTSSGLHTNGYSLARKVLLKNGPSDLKKKVLGNKTIADLLLVPHKSYLHTVMKLIKKVHIHGMAHLTGGGFDYNIIRILPENTEAVIDRRTWDPPFIFKLIQKKGNVDEKEMYDVFNMGIGMALFVPYREADKALKILDKLGEKHTIIGRMIRNKLGKRVTLLP